MNKPHLIKSLAIAWPITNDSRAYAIHILGQLGHRPAFPQAPHYCQLWANVTAGKLLGRGVTKWEAELATEADRLTRIKANYDKEVSQTKAEIAAALARRRAIMAAQDEIDQALSRRLGY
jgi:hypothetical protein